MPLSKEGTLWPHSRSWGYAPGGVVGLVVVILLILLLSGGKVQENLGKVEKIVGK